MAPPLGHLTPDEARQQARDWGWDEPTLEAMIACATAPPSYWAQHAAGTLPPPTAILRPKRDDR